MSTPVHEAPAAQAGRRANAPSALPSVLMVDDQPARLLTYEAILQGLNVNCVRAQSGEAALTHLLAQPFALVLLDVNMPGMDGFEVARHIRAHPRLGSLPIIFVTGERLTDLDTLRGYEVGAIDYISVPVVPEILRSKVALLVELHQRRADLEAVTRAARAPAAERAGPMPGATPEQLRAFFEHPTQTSVLLQAERDAHGRIVDFIYRDANGKALEVLGLSRAQILGQRLGTLLGDDAPARIELCRRVLETGEPTQYENDFRGREHLVTLYPVGNDFLAGTGLDITVRKHTETQLAISRRRFQAMLENAPVGVAQNGLDGRFLYVNAAFCALTGYSAEELYGMTWQQITHPDDLGADLALAGRVLSGEISHYTMEKRYVRKDGKSIWVALHGSFLFDDARRPMEGLAVVIDVTERRLADERLRASEERFRELANNIDQFAWTCDSLGSASWYNDRWYEYTGTTFETMRDDGWQLVHHPDHVERVRAHILRCLEAGMPWEDTFPLRGKDGEYRWFLSRAVPIRDQKGEVVRWFGTNTDVTALRDLQEALRVADRRKDEFLAMLAHELRNPVAPILNVAQLLSRQLAGDERSRALVGIVQRQAAHLSRLLDDLLDVARITRGRIELKRSVVSLNDAVRHAIESCDIVMRAKHQRLDVRLADERPCVEGDEVRITQCLANLLNNAVKYTPARGDIRVRTRVVEGWVEVEVADTGSGITPEFLPHMFELFAQGERTLDRSQGGLGIGLSVCKRLVEMHGGTITGTSDGPNRGAAFTVRLPLVSTRAQRAADGRQAAPAPQRVLVVDDNSDAADSLAMLLEMDGHEVRTVYSAEAALAEAPSFAPDHVLLDIGLPSMDGYEVARRLRQSVPAASLVAVSGYGQVEDQRRAAAAGFHAHLVKPVDFQALQILIGPRR